MSKRLWWIIIGACAFAILAGLIIHGTQAHKGSNSAQHSPAVPQIAYSTYVNARFAYSVCYPQQILVPQGESPDGDGQKFVSGDGQVMAFVYGTNNALGQSLQQVLNQDAEGVTLSNQTLTTNIFVFSGKAPNNTMVMEETLFQDQKFKTLNLRFPAAMAVTYAPIAERMIACFANTTPTQYSQ